MPSAVEELREEIRAAFAWRPYPGDDQLALSRPDCPGYEGDAVGRFFRGRDWREITYEAIMGDLELDLNAFIFFLTAEGFVYYLPAFLSLSLDVDGPFDLGDRLSGKLTPPPPDGGDSWHEQFSQIVASLTPREKRAVVHVLEYLAGESEKRLDGINVAQRALDRCWAQFTDTKE